MDYRRKCRPQKLVVVIQSADLSAMLMQPSKLSAMRTQSAALSAGFVAHRAHRTA